MSPPQFLWTSSHDPENSRASCLQGMRGSRGNLVSRQNKQQVRPVPREVQPGDELRQLRAPPTGAHMCVCACVCMCTRVCTPLPQHTPSPLPPAAVIPRGTQFLAVSWVPRRRRGLSLYCPPWGQCCFVPVPSDLSLAAAVLPNTESVVIVRECRGWHPAEQRREEPLTTQAHGISAWGPSTSRAVSWAPHTPH